LALPSEEEHVRFGAFVPQGWRLDQVGVPAERQWAAMQDVARTIEEAGYESLWVYDHLHTTPVATQEPTFEAWSLMAALAASTSTVRLGQMCTCNGYRSPSYLAKVAATIDVISGGRLEMGIGAGWYEQEFLAYGYEFPPIGTRLGQLREGVEIMRRMWTEERVDFEGRHYRLTGAICSPRPLQQPHVPLWIAGGGVRTTLRIAARRAAYTNFGISLDDFREKSDALAGHCRDVGRDFGEIVRTTNFNVVIAPTEAEVEDRLRWLDERLTPFFPPERIPPSKLYRDDGLVGTPDQIVEQVRAWKGAGLDYAICYFPEAAHDQAAIELFAREVMPALG
jgi:F420-dependent oxidoreductase-like protein